MFKRAGGRNSIKTGIFSREFACICRRMVRNPIEIPEIILKRGIMKQRTGNANSPVRWVGLKMGNNGVNRFGSCPTADVHHVLPVDAHAIHDYIAVQVPPSSELQQMRLG